MSSPCAELVSQADLSFHLLECLRGAVCVVDGWKAIRKWRCWRWWSMKLGVEADAGDGSLQRACPVSMELVSIDCADAVVSCLSSCVWTPKSSHVVAHSASVDVATRWLVCQRHL